MNARERLKRQEDAPVFTPLNCLQEPRGKGIFSWLALLNTKAFQTKFGKIYVVGEN